MHDDLRAAVAADMAAKDIAASAKRISKSFGDSVDESVDAVQRLFVKVKSTLERLVKGIGDWFGKSFGNVVGTAIGTALGPVLSQLANQLTSWLGDVASSVLGFLSGTGDHTLAELREFRQRLPQTFGGLQPPRFNPAFGGEQTLSGTVPNPKGDKGGGSITSTNDGIERVNTITSRAATATVQQEERLIAIEQTSLVVLRQMRDLLTTLATGGVQITNRMEADANRSRLLGGDALVGA